jgi:hypothetical protein
MAKKYKIKSCLICDLARKEQGGKDILIGIYSGTMMSQVIPFSIPIFAVWIEMKPEKTHYEHLTIEIVDPNGTLVAGAKGGINFSDTRGYTGIPFQFGTATFLVEGKYKIRFGSDNLMEEIGEFSVKKGEIPQIKNSLP